MDEYEHHRMRHGIHRDDDGTPDVEAHRFRRAEDGTDDDDQQPDVEAHHHKWHHKWHTDEQGEDKDEPDVEAHRFK
jgi:hypothetical protein